MITEVAGIEMREHDSLPPERLAAPMQLPYLMENFRLEEEIGRGGMGIVYRATRLTDGQTVAIKIMIKGEFASGIDRKRFEAEAEAVSGLDHPNVIPIYEVGEHHGRPFFCMKLIKGRTLAQWLSAGPISSEKAARLMLKICGGIQQAHERGILHRDLKPSNILIDASENPYICDFGLAKQTREGASLTKSGAVIGTPSYMAPEQAAGARGQVGVVSDVYSLGAILYHMLTGRPPFLATSPVDTVLMVLEQDPIPPRALNRQADRKLEMITLRCLQKPQDLRYATADELANDLHAYLHGDLISAEEGRLGQVIVGLFRETHHAAILENWGMLWMWHSLVLLVASLATQTMYGFGVTTRIYYELMWGIGFGTWAWIFWHLRRRHGPVTFVERQIAHVWAANLVGVVLLFPFEGYLGVPLMSLSPLLSITAAMSFIVKAGVLSGSFYIQAGVLVLTAVLMAVLPGIAMLIFGVVAGLCFFLPGLKYYRRRQRNPNPSVPGLFHGGRG
jgi:serine/threonine-protein kinase